MIILLNEGVVRYLPVIREKNGQHLQTNLEYEY